MNDEYAIKNLAAAMLTVLGEAQFATILETLEDADNAFDADAQESRLLLILQYELEELADEHGIAVGIDRVIAEQDKRCGN